MTLEGETSLIGDDNLELGPSPTTASTATESPSTEPRARELFRRGAVYGLAGVLKATDVAVAAARGAVRGARDGVSEHSDGTPRHSDGERVPRERRHS
jgi:hypothetical protein